MAVKERERLITAEELFEMGDIGPCELVKGVLVMQNPTGARHGYIVAKLARLLGNFAEERDLGVVLGPGVGLLVSRRPDTVRAPDLMFYRKGRLDPSSIPEGYLDVPPDLVVEVVSPSDSWSDVEAKVEEYLGMGVKAVWVVDPQRRAVTVLPERRTLKEGEALEGGEALPGLSIPVSTLFE